MVESMGVKIRFQTVESAIFENDTSLEVISSKGKHIGYLGAIKEEIAKIFELESTVYAFHASAEPLLDIIGKRKNYEEIPPFPSTRRDVALIVDSSIQVGNLLKVAKENGSEMLEHVFIFDLYEGDPIPEGKKSVGIAAIMKNPEKTITDEEANSLHQKIVDALVKEFDAEIRK